MTPTREQHAEQVARERERERGDDDRDRQQRLEEQDHDEVAARATCPTASGEPSARRTRRRRAGDSPPAPAAAPTRLATAMNSAPARRELDAERALVRAERLQPRADRLGLRARARVAARRASPAPPRAAAQRRHRRALQRGPQLARRGLGVLGLGDRAHDDDPRRAALDDLVRRCPRRARRSRTTACRPCSPRARRSPARRPGGPAWSASRARGRPRGSRRRGRRRRPRPASGAWVERPTIRSGPTAARACAGVASSWPTCTPSAPHASTRSGRSLRMNSASWPRNAPRRRDEPVVVERLVAQLDQVDAAAHRRLDPVARPRRADEVQAGGGEALAWRHPSGDTMTARTREPADRAERAPPGRRPSNLIRVVPA